MAHRYDLIVVGAGPAGSAAALAACRLGIKSVAILERSGWPRKKPCGSGLSPKARGELKRIGLWDEVSRAAYPVAGLVLKSPAGKTVTLSGAESAHVLNRERLDPIIASASVRAGALLQPGTRVTACKRAPDGLMSVTTSRGEFRSRWVIDAGGANSILRPGGHPRTLLHTAIASYENVTFAPNMVEMVYDPLIAPHYAWLFPESDTRANIGLCVSPDRLGRTSIRELFETIRDGHFKSRLASAVEVEPVRGHPISISSRIPPAVGCGNVLSAGEAAGLANPATGEGISYALLSGRLAAEAIAAGMERNHSAWEIATRYRALLRSQIGPGLFFSDLFVRHGIGLLDLITDLGNSKPFSYLGGKFMAGL